MDCISYVNDLLIEIDILNKINNDDVDIQKKIKETQKKIEMVKDNLSKISINSIEYRLYLKILNGKTPTQAVNEVADLNFNNDIKPHGTTQIGKYYKKIKIFIN